MAQVKPHELERHLARALRPVYFVFGDEPLQNEASLDHIRAATRAAGFEERVSLFADANFDWRQLYEMRDAVSLFAERRLFDVRMGSLRLAKDEGGALKDYVASPNPDNVLLISAGSIGWREQKLAWFKALSAGATVVRSWPVDAEQLPRWIEQRARGVGVRLNREAVETLAAQTEGNLLATAQELDLLALLHPDRMVTAEDVLSTASFNSRYSHNDLADAALAGDAARVVRVARGLEEEGAPAPLVSWALSNCVRELGPMVERVARGERAQTVAGGVRNFRRRGAFSNALARLRIADLPRLTQRAYMADRAVKGVASDPPWHALRLLALDIAGHDLLRDADAQVP